MLMENNKLRKIAFFPPFLILAVFVVISMASKETFLGIINSINNWIIKNIGWAASILALAIVVISLWAAFSKFGSVRIGGEKAKPELSTFSWFSIALCTTMAAGILFWGPGEPIAHYLYPPTELYGVKPASPESLKFAMETMFLHWTIVPYAMYTLPGVVFAFMYYNAKKPFSIASEISPLLGDRVYGKTFMQVIDGITLFAIGCGMAGSVAQAFMNISGGIAKITGLPSDKRLWLIIGIILAVTVICSAVSGLQRGLKMLSNINVVGFGIFLVFLLIMSNLSFLLNLSTEALGGFAGTFLERILITGESVDSQWPQWWTTFYWFSWMAWAPTSGAFMGRIAKGRTVKQMIGMYVGVCAAMSGIWMIIVSGTALWVNHSGQADLAAAYDKGVENVPYEMLASMPGGFVIIVLFVILIFLSTVTACDSNALVMAGISSTGISPESPEAKNWLKIVWTIIPMAVGYIMIAAVGVDGVKIIANFGGMFAALIMAAATASLVVLIRKYKKFDKTIEESNPDLSYLDDDPAETETAGTAEA